MRYPVVIHHEPGTSYGVTVPDLPGCFSGGETMEDALKKVEEAMDLHLESMVEDNEEIPLAGQVDDYLLDVEYNGGVWALVDVDITKYLGTTDKINITLPHNLIKKIDDLVSTVKDYKSRSGFLQEAALSVLRNLEKRV